jgi:hypothetical protein
MAGPSVNGAILDHLIKQYAAGKHSVGDKIVELLKPRIEHMVSSYMSRTRLSVDDLRSAAYHGVAVGLNNVDVEIGQPHAYLCQRAFWSLLKAIQSHDYRGGHKTETWIPSNVNYGLDIVFGGFEDTGSESVKGKFKAADANKMLEAILKEDIYDMETGRKKWWEKYCANQNDVEVVLLYLKYGTYEAVAKVKGVTKQAICARFKRMSKLAKEMGHDHINYAA